jgi:ubiquitin C-terminal hydrolase
MLGDNRNFKEEKGFEWDTKEFKLLSTPTYFIISLKRFEYDIKTKQNKKISDKVEIPLELEEKDLIEFMYKNEFNNYNDPGTYDLYAVTMQSGESDGGHYYSYIRKPKFTVNDVDLNSGPFTPGWYEANDSTFNRLREDIKEKIKGGYIFYYKKRDLDDEYPHMLGNEDVRYQYV